jgi:hypothetical protein
MPFFPNPKAHEMFDSGTAIDHKLEIAYQYHKEGVEKKGFDSLDNREQKLFPVLTGENLAKTKNQRKSVCKAGSGKLVPRKHSDKKKKRQATMVGGLPARKKTNLTGMPAKQAKVSNPTI